MAILNVELTTTNLTPSSGGQYVFTANFYNTNTDTLSTDPRFPQNQTYSVGAVGNKISIPLEVANGQYTISNITLKVSFKNIIKTKDLAGKVVNCVDECDALPISSVVAVNATTYTVNLTNIATETYAWRVFNKNAPSVVVANGTANTTTGMFNITTPQLSSGDYLLEVTGSNCRGKSIKPFSVSTTLPACAKGPTLVSILSSSATSLKFQFDGNSVFGLTWRIKQGSSTPRNGVLMHVSQAKEGDKVFTDSTPTIEYATLPNGTYTLELEGYTCSSSVSSLTFTVNTAEIPLAFISGSPAVSGSGTNYAISIAINKSGSYNTVILNSSTGTYEQNGNITYTAGNPYIRTGLSVGSYIIRVGSLQTTLKIESSGSGGNCSHGPILKSILNTSATGLSFLFDANNVTAIAWRIKQGDNVVRNGIVYPVNNTPYINFNELANGEYTLEIQGSNCTSAVSSGSFSIVPVAQSNNAGVIVTNAGGKYIGIINARYFKATANSSTGAIRLSYDETSTADGSSTPVRAWLLGSQLQEIKPSEVAALRSAEGLVLPDGAYNFYLYYFPSNITSFSQLKDNIHLLSNAGWQQHSKVLEEVIIEVRSNLTA